MQWAGCSSSGVHSARRRSVCCVLVLWRCVLERRGIFEHQIVMGAQATSKLSCRAGTPRAGADAGGAPVQGQDGHGRARAHVPAGLLVPAGAQRAHRAGVRGVRARVEACAACGRAQRAGKHATGPCATILRPRSACLTWIEWCGRNLGTWRAPQVLKECEECEEQGLPPPFYASDAKMADSVMDFLFASQVRAWHAQHHSVCGT